MEFCLLCTSLLPFWPRRGFHLMTRPRLHSSLLLLPFQLAQIPPTMALPKSWSLQFRPLSLKSLSTRPIGKLRVWRILWARFLYQFQPALLWQKKVFRGLYCDLLFETKWIIWIRQAGSHRLQQSPRNGLWSLRSLPCSGGKCIWRRQSLWEG